MPDLKEGRVLLREDEMRQKMLEGAQEAFIAVATSYGPKGRNVLIEKGFGYPVLTRDGDTIVRDVFFTDRAKNMGAQTIIQASKNANYISGDGSSATVVLSYNLLKNSDLAIKSGVHPMAIREMLTEDSHKLIAALDDMAIEVKDDQLKDVATVSSGDKNVGLLISEAVLHVGTDGGILTEKAPINEIEQEYVDGYYMQAGFTALQAGKKEVSEPLVIISNRRVSSKHDANKIIVTALQSKGITPESIQKTGEMPRFLFIGNFEGEAYAFLVDMINKGMIDAVLVGIPPMYGELGKYLLDDIGIYCRCAVITDNTALSSLDASYVGTVNRVIASKSEATLFGDNESEAVKTRVAELRAQIEDEEVDAISEKLRDRVAKLEGKICLFKIGAPTEMEREELEFRIEDAINSTRNAYAEGIVPGGGITLLELSKLEISGIFRKSLQETFQQLLVNANLQAEVKLAEALNAKKGYGFNLRKDGELVDMIEEGIIDPVVVPREAIRHAASSVGSTVTIGAGLIFDDSKNEKE